MALDSMRGGGEGAGLPGISFFFQAEDGIRDLTVTGVQTCALPICVRCARRHQLHGHGLQRADPDRARCGVRARYAGAPHAAVPAHAALRYDWPAEPGPPGPAWPATCRAKVHVTAERCTSQRGGCRQAAPPSLTGPRLAVKLDAWHGAVRRVPGSRWSRSWWCSS